jgi:hypothetical protein
LVSVSRAGLQAVWALGNIAGDTPASRNLVLNAGVMPAMLGERRDEAHSPLLTWHRPLCVHFAELFEKPDLDVPFLRNLVWAVSNLCRFKPKPFHTVGGARVRRLCAGGLRVTALPQLSAALPVLAKQLHSTDEQVLSDVCWCLSYLSDDDTDQVPHTHARTHTRTHMLQPAWSSCAFDRRAHKCARIRARSSRPSCSLALPHAW